MSKLLTAMAKLKMDFGLGVDDVLDLSDRDGVLLALHLFQVKPRKSTEQRLEEWHVLGVSNTPDPSEASLTQRRPCKSHMHTKGGSACYPILRKTSCLGGFPCCLFLAHD